MQFAVEVICMHLLCQQHKKDGTRISGLTFLDIKRVCIYIQRYNQLTTTEEGHWRDWKSWFSCLIINCFFFYIGLMCHFNFVVLYIYIIQQFSSIYVVVESTLLNNANPCRNWTFQRIARAAQKKGRNGTNEKSDTRWYSNPGPRLF